MSGIKSKLKDIKHKIANLQLDVLIRIEIWLTRDISSNELLSGTDIYVIIRTDREDIRNNRSRGGGVLIAVHKKLKAENIIFPTTFLIEATACIIEFINIKMVIIAIYSPGYDKQVQSNDLIQLYDYINHWTK